MPKEQRTFSKEFKLEALRLAQSSGKSMTQIARDKGLPIARCTIGAKCLPGKEIRPSWGVDIETAQEEEIRRLKRELETVRQERDILKKVVSIYSRESR